jgi:hypothetical protein
VVFGEDFEDGGEGLFGGLLGGVVGLGHGCWWFGLEKGYLYKGYNGSTEGIL